MKLTLRIDGKNKTFFSKGITMLASLKAFELSGDIDRRTADNTLYTKEHVDALTEWVLDLFDHKFSLEELLGGCEESFFVVIPQMLSAVVAGTNAAIDEFPNGVAPEA